MSLITILEHPHPNLRKVAAEREAAGIAATLADENSLVDISRLQSTLEAYGAILQDE